MAMAGDKDAAADRPWMNTALSPDERAKLLERAMTLEEKIGMLHGKVGTPFRGEPKPDGAVGSAGYIAGIPRLGVPALQESDAGLGVANPGNVRPGDDATALPASLALAATWSAELAYQSGVVIGNEARRKGLNVMLAGGKPERRGQRRRVVAGPHVARIRDAKPRVALLQRRDTESRNRRDIASRADCAVRHRLATKRRAELAVQEPDLLLGCHHTLEQLRALVGRERGVHPRSVGGRVLVGCRGNGRVESTTACVTERDRRPRDNELADWFASHASLFRWPRAGASA